MSPSTLSPERRRENARHAGRISARLREIDGLARHIERVVDAAPPLTEAQRARLAALLRPTSDGGTA